MIMVPSVRYLALTSELSQKGRSALARGSSQHQGRMRESGNCLTARPSPPLLTTSLLMHSWISVQLQKLPSSTLCPPVGSIFVVTHAAGLVEIISVESFTKVGRELVASNE
jgi:hypothetical protein